MKEEFDLKGKWWIPTDPGNTIAGKMNFVPSKGVVLNLGGRLKETETCDMPFKIVLGETEDGRAVTLIGSNGVWLERSYQTKDDGEPDEPTCTALSANVLLIGKHYQSPEEIRFKGFSIDFSYLSEWARCIGPECSSRSRDEPFVLECEIGLLGKLFIESDKNSSCKLTMDLNGEIGLDRGIEMVRQLRNLMALLMHRPTHEIRVWGIGGRGTDDIGPIAPVEIFYPSFARDRDAKPLDLEDMLLPLGSIGGELGNIIAKWFAINEDSAQILDLYFAASQSAELYHETRFLLYMQAMEAYHRLRFRNFEVDPEEHVKRLAIILSSIPEQYREWMQDGLEYSNEPSTGQRLKEIFDDLREIMDEFVDDRKKFIFQLTKTRNRLMHSMGNGDDMTLSGNDMLLATIRLRMLLEMCLLKEIGIGPGQIREAALRNSMFSQIRVRSGEKENE